MSKKLNMITQILSCGMQVFKKYIKFLITSEVFIFEEEIDF